MNLQVSAIVIVGSQRIRAQRCITALCEQQDAHQLEIVIFDYKASTFEKLITHGDASIIYLPPNEHATWGQARAYAIKQSTAPLLALLEEHTQPHQGWLTALMDAFETHDLSAATYSFVSGNNNNYVARAGHIAEYGLWSAPASKISTTFMPWNNYAVLRSFLMSHEGDLDQFLEIDIGLFDYIRQTKAKFMQLNDALVTHISHENFISIMTASYYGGQLVAHQRVQDGNWGWARRVTYAITAPLIVPWMRTWRLFRHYLSMPKNLWEFIMALPIIIILYIFSSISEGIGYITLSEKAYDVFIDVEIHMSRDSTIDV